MASNPEAAEVLTSLDSDITLPAKLHDSISRYRHDAARYRGAAFKEMSIRSEFINPLLEELGWDVTNRSGALYSEREVIEEDSLTIEGSRRAPDYCMLIQGDRKFFVEAKRPSVDLSKSRDSAYQIRRYCWSARLPFGLITDFEEFAIYDCRAAPNLSDSVEVGRIDYFRYEDLPAKWGRLSELFGRDAVAGGSLERLAASSRPPRNTRPIDEAFLDELRGWRRELAADIAAQNRQLDVVALNAAVQNLIDRLVFLRIAEARGLEPYEELRTAAAGPHVYSRLLRLFARADDRYNSGLFNFAAKSSDQGTGTVDPDLLVNDALLSRMIQRLYYPEPYEFSVLPADILGRIYEQFLGELIALGPDRSTSIELRPDARKAGGVYYTPEPIVRYIIEETIGPLLKGKNPNAVARLRIVDPACGSGSFLIAAFQFLLDWHREYYSAMQRDSAKYLEMGSDGQIRVRTGLRKQILLNNIYGVDIDPQAVEVAKLSLLLKVIEGQGQMELEIGRLLPDLDHNLRCGNSLIDTDFPMPLALDRREALLFNPFSWENAFPEVFESGGFDAVVGNPPYLNIDNVWGRRDQRLAYIRSKYPEVYSDKTDILFYFLRKAVAICKGEIGFIVSRSFLEANKALRLRGWLAIHTRVRHVLDFRHAQVFPGVGINTAIVRLTSSKVPRVTRFSRYRERDLPPGYTPATLRDPERISTVEVPVAILSSASWSFGDASIEAVLAKIDEAGEPVRDILKVGQGMQTGRNGAFRFVGTEERRRELAAAGLLYERVRNSDIARYQVRPSGVQLLYLEDVRSFAMLPRDVQEQLKSAEPELKARAAFLRGDCDWWRYTWPLHRENFSRPRIWCPYRASENRFALDSRAQFLGITDTTVLFENDQPEDLRYILGFLNSRILSARFRFIGKLLGGGVVEYYENTVGSLPIPRRSPGDEQHDRMVALVTRRQEVAFEIASSQLHDEIWELTVEGDRLDREIEALVAVAIGLSADEVALLEGELNEQ